MTPARSLLFVGGLLLAAASLVLSSQQPAMDAPVENPSATRSVSSQQRLGIETYRHYCETCHGVEGRGDGFNAFNLDPKPPDFTSDVFQSSRTDEQLLAAVANGGRASGRSAGMPPWGRTLSPQVQRAVLRHIRRFGPAALPVESGDPGE
jgi:mono/diheme cytochrome c family protein